MMQQFVISKVNYMMNNWILAVCCIEWMCSCVSWFIYVYQSASPVIVCPVASILWTCSSR